MKGRKRYVVIVALLISLIYFFYFQNNAIQTTEHTISSTKIPKSFDGYKIVQLSDLHSKSFGANQRKIVKRTENSNPDLIVFTGDLVDSKRYDEEVSLLLMEELVKIAPVYFVTGNHEWWSGKFDILEAELIDAGVNVMRNTAEEISIGDDKINLLELMTLQKSKVSQQTRK